MPRQRAVLAAMFVIVVVAAAALLYRADRERVRAIAERSAQTTEAPAVVTPQTEPATDSASSAAAPPAEQPVVPSSETGAATAQQTPAAEKPATVEASPSIAGAPQETTAATEPEQVVPAPAPDQESPAPAGGVAAQPPKDAATADIPPAPPATNPPEAPGAEPAETAAAPAAPSAPAAPASSSAVAEVQPAAPPASEPDATTGASTPEASTAGAPPAAPQTSHEVETEEAPDELTAASPTIAPPSATPGEQTGANAAATDPVPAEPLAEAPPAQPPNASVSPETLTVAPEVQPLDDETAAETKAPAAEIPEGGEPDTGTEIAETTPAEPAAGIPAVETPTAATPAESLAAEPEPLEEEAVTESSPPTPQSPGGEAGASENEVAAVKPSAGLGTPAADETAPAIGAGPDVAGQIPFQMRPAILVPPASAEPEVPVVSAAEPVVPEVPDRPAREVSAAEPIETEEAGIASPQLGEAAPLTTAPAEEQDQQELAIAEPTAPAIGGTMPKVGSPLISDADRGPPQDLAATEPPPVPLPSGPSASVVSEQTSPGAAATTSPAVPDTPPAEPVEIAGATAEAHEIGGMQVAPALQVITPPVEIAGTDTNVASLSSSSVSAAATIAALELSDIVGSATDNQTRSVAPVSEAPSGVLEADGVTIRAAEAEANTLYVAGAAAPGAAIKVYADNNLVGEATASDGGVWLVEAQKEIPVGEINIRAEVVSEIDVAAAPIAEASVPFMRYPDGIVLEPIVTATMSERSLRSESKAALTPSYVIIRRGDNLWRIARRNYGRGIKYKAIFAANQDLIDDPHWIFPGQVFVVPTRDLSWERAVE